MRILVLWENKEFLKWSYDYLKENGNHEIEEHEVNLKEATLSYAARLVNAKLQLRKIDGKHNYDIIIGPSTSELIPHLLKQPELKKNKIPLITTNATSSLLSELSSDYPYYQMGVNNEHRVEVLLDAIIKIYDKKNLNLYIFTKSNQKQKQNETIEIQKANIALDEGSTFTTESNTKVPNGSKIKLDSNGNNSAETENVLEFINYSYSKNLRDEVIKQFINSNRNNVFRKYLFHDISFTSNKEIIQVITKESSNEKKRKKIVTHIKIKNDLPLNRSYPIVICAESLDTVALVKHLRDRGNKNLIFAFGNNDKMRKHIMEGSYFVTDKDSNPNEKDESSDENTTIAKSLTNELVNYLNSTENLDGLKDWVRQKNEGSKILKENLSVLGMEMNEEYNGKKELLFNEIGDFDKEKVKKEQEEKETEEKFVLLTLKELKESNATNRKSLDRLDLTIRELQESKETNKKSLETAIKSIGLSKKYFYVSITINILVLIIAFLSLFNSCNSEQNLGSNIPNVNDSSQIHGK